MTDPLFHLIPDVQVILRSGNGLFRQVPVYRKALDGEHALFAKAFGGYVLLLGSGGTSVPKLTWSDLFDPCGGCGVGKLGRPIWRRGESE